MQKIAGQYHALLASETAGSEIPEAFIAALVGNETGGDTSKTRFEPAIFQTLAMVLIGQKSHYGVMGTQDLLMYVSPEDAFHPYTGPATPDGFIGRLNRLKTLATSWGLTQILGIDALALNKSLGMIRPGNPRGQIDLTVTLLEDFAKRFSLDPKLHAAELFRCWNGGTPTAETADPNYVQNGLNRQNVYEQLLQKAAVK